MSNLVHSTTDGGIATLALNRPEKRNALNVAMLEALRDAVAQASEAPSVRVIVIRGHGPVFCAGLDLAEITDPAMCSRQAQLLARTLLLIYHAPKVTIARIHGAAIAGGAALIGACDLAVATVDSLFGYPAVQRGITASLAMPFLRRQLGERHTRELLLLGEIIDAARAQEIGLITRAVPSDLLDEQVALHAGQVLQAAPAALWQSKRCLDATWPSLIDDDLRGALALHLETCATEEAVEGVRAYLEKRAPQWRP